MEPSAERYDERFRELEEIERAERDRVVRIALGKFNFFLHLTAYLSGCAYLLLMGIIYRPALPWVFIPLGLWTALLCYHAWRAFRPLPPAGA